MSKKGFNRIGLIGRTRVKSISTTLCAIQQHLLKQGKSVYLESTCAERIKDVQGQQVNTEQLSKTVDLLIVVGGDGSLLQAAQLGVQHNLPVLGINRGNLGFLTDINPNDFDKIDQVLAGNYHLEQRFLLHAELYNEPDHCVSAYALNEVLISSKRSGHMLAFDTYIDGQFVCQQRADGIIINTPTGSTAYALSAGGPILHPQLAVMALTPLSSHTLSSRPLVIDSSQQIEIVITSIRTHAQISCDGREQLTIPPTGKVRIKKADKSLALVHPADYDYYKTLREKLGWQSHKVS